MRPAFGFVSVLVLAAAGLIGSGCGETVIDQAKLEDGLQASLEESVEGRIGTIDCPSDQEVEAKARFNCSVRFENGDTATVTIEIRNEDADVDVVDFKPNE